MEKEILTKSKMEKKKYNKDYTPEELSLIQWNKMIKGEKIYKYFITKNRKEVKKNG